jgi:hypothetical protein
MSIKSFFYGLTPPTCPDLDNLQPICVTFSGKGFVHFGGEASLRLGSLTSFDVGAVLGGQVEIAGRACFKMDPRNGDVSYDSSKVCVSGGFYLRARFYGEINIDLWSGSRCW